jgi:putative tryptophan/tyrosine transport system substrate-binding protein
MKRRVLVGGVGLGLLAAPLAAQSQRKPPRIGWLGGPTRESAEFFVRPFMQGLSALGWVEGQNIVIEWRFAGGNAERLRELAAELVELPVDLIVVPSTPPALAARNATRTIPIVTVSVGDPVALGLVKSLARPEGNITGLTSSVDPKLTGKLLELLKEGVPGATRIAMLWNPATPGNAVAAKQAAASAAALGVELRTVEARSAGELDAAFAAIKASRAGALLVAGDILFLTHRARLTELAARSGVPAIYGDRSYVEAGGLMSYGALLLDLFRRAASYVDRLLKGARPSDLPIEQPSKFELVINLSAAKALGWTVPQSLLLRADDVIR